MAPSTPRRAEDAAVPVGELTYTEASRELDAIVAFFEQRDVDVDQLVVRLERATAIVGELDQRLRRTRVQVEQLVPKLAAVLAEVPPDGELGDDEPDGEPADGELADEEPDDEPADRELGDEPSGPGDGHPGLF